MKKSLFFSFSLIGSVGFAVAVPLVAMTLIGRYIDNRLSTSPRFLIILIVLSTIPAYFSVKKIAEKAAKRLKSLK